MTKPADQPSLQTSQHLRRGMVDLLEQTAKFEFQTILDIGTGDGFASRHFVSQGKEVTATGFDMNSYLTTPLPHSVKQIQCVDVCRMTGIPDASFDAVWCSHVLEHVQNPGLALTEIRRILKPTGILFLIVPEYAPVVVGGHVSTGWNVGTLMYNLVLSGFNVGKGEFINHCWNICGFVRRGDLPSVELRFDKGDLELLSCYFPKEANVHQHMNASLFKVRWDWHPSIRVRAEAAFRSVGLWRQTANWIPPVLFNALRRFRPGK